MNIPKLRTIIKKKSDELSVYRERLEQAEFKKLFPELKKKYEGKYFVYDNGYSYKDRWKMYVFCHEVTSTSSGIITSFQIITDCKNDFQVKNTVPLSLCQKEISKKRYDTELNKFLKLVSRLSQ